jgi:hypothetical protein
MTKFWKLLLSTLSFALTIWIYWRVWSISEPIGKNTVDAAEAGVPDTVSQSEWLELGLLFIALVGAWLLTWSLATSSRNQTFPVWQALFIFAIPLATTALFPYLGFFAPIFAFWISVAGLVGRLIRADRKSSQ